MNVGVVGLGLMGSGMATRLIKTGQKISVYNRNRSKSESFAKMGAKVASTPAEVARDCDFILTCVTDFEAVKEVFFGKDGIASAKRKGFIVGDSSTISPAQSEYCAKTFREKGIEMLGIPVMGGPAAAESGELIPIVAGNKQAMSKVRPILDKLGKSIFYVGERDGTANAIKLALNLNIALIAIALSEGITLVRKYGVDPKIFVDVINSTYFKTGLSEKKGPKMINNDFAPSFHLKNMLKDIELATETAQNLKLSLPNTALAQQIYRAASNSGFSEQDYTAICAFLSRINGMDDRQ